jgi:hypothetical protein
MPSYTLWALAEPRAEDLLLVSEAPDGSMGQPVHVGDERAIIAFLSAHGMPAQIVANLWLAVRRLRQADARLFQVPASVLKAKELVGPLVAIALRGYRLQGGSPR